MFIPVTVLSLGLFLTIYSILICIKGNGGSSLDSDEIDD